MKPNVTLENELPMPWMLYGWMWANFALFIFTAVISFLYTYPDESAVWPSVTLGAIGVLSLVVWVIAVIKSAEAQMWGLCWAAIVTPFFQYGWILFA